MIILERALPNKLEVLEALLRRLPENDVDFEYYHDLYKRAKSGFDGEQKVDNEWNEIHKHKNHYLLHNLELRKEIGASHQIDTLYICPHFMVVLEIKNISGRIDFEQSKHQFIRTREDGIIQGFFNPIDQARRHVRLLQSFNFQLPIEYAIVIANPSTIIGAIPKNAPILHASGLQDLINSLTQKYANHHMSKDKLLNIVNKLLQLHSPSKWLLDIDLNKLRKGIYCEKCDYKREMEYSRGAWKCDKCSYESDQVLLQALNDYRLLISNKITNREFRDFINMKSRNIATRILRKLELPFEGPSNKYRVYTIPENIMMADTKRSSTRA